MRKAGIEEENFEHLIDKAVMKRENIRPQQNMDYVSPLDIPENLKKDGYDYSWVSYSIRGEATFNVEQKMREGWTVVPVSRAKEYATDFIGRNPVGKKYITYKDVVLMERPVALGEKDRLRLAQINSHQIRSLRGVSNDIKGVEAPLHVMNRSH